MSEHRKCPKCGSGLSLNTIIWDSPTWYCIAYCGWKPKEKKSKLKEFINNIIADLESNIKFQPIDILYADMAGKLSAYRYIKKRFLKDVY